jgi:hypothetical protein
LDYLHRAIDRSRDMLNWEENWDGEGSPGYAQATWDRAVDFIVRNAAQVYNRLGVRIAEPVIKPGPEGSIDIDWTSGNRRLLVNIPVSEDEPATYYGSDGANNTLEGSLDTSGDNQWMLMWMAA